MAEKERSTRTPAQPAEAKADAAYQEELAKLKTDIGQLQSDVAELVGLLKTSAASKGSDIKDKVNDEAEHIFDELMGRLNEGISHGKRSFDEVSERIGEHPVSTLFITFSLGYILAKLTERGGGSGKDS